MKKESVFAGNYEGPLYAPHPDLKERADTWHPDPEKDRKLGGPGANQRAREDRAAAAKKSSSGQKSDPKKLRKGESYMDYAKRQKAGKSASAPKPKERKRDKIGRKLGNLVDRIGGIKKEEVSIDEGKKKGLWDRIHAKRKRGERPARPGEKRLPQDTQRRGY